MKKSFLFKIMLLIFSINLFANDKIDTPMELVYKNKFGENITTYHRYAQFFLDSKVAGNKNSLKKILSSKDRYLKYYEAILKGLYYYSFNENDKSDYLIGQAYDRKSEILKNTFEGLLVQNTYLSKNNLLKANKLISNKYYCKSLSSKVDQKACLANIFTLSCLNQSEDFFDNLIELNSLDIEISKYAFNYCIINQNK